MGIRKGELIEKLYAAGIREFAGQELPKLTIPELKELLAQENPEEQQKKIKDPMAGLARLRRSTLEGILSNLDGQRKRSERNKGQILMKIRTQLATYEGRVIEIGKIKGLPFQILLEHESYMKWMEDTVKKSPGADPRLREMNQYCRLMRGTDVAEAKIKGEEEDEVSDMEVGPKPFPQDEPIMMEKVKQPVKAEIPPTTKGNSSSSTVKIVKPEWTGKEEDWEEYAQACQIYAVRMRGAGEFNSMKDSEKRSRQ